MPNPPTPTRKTAPKSPKPAAKHKVSPTSAKGGPKTPETMAQDTVTLSPTLLAALITRSIAKGFEPILAELRDIARTSHDTSDRLFGQELKAKAEHDARLKKYLEARMQDVVPAPSQLEELDESRRLQGLMDKLWAQGYRPSNEKPLVCRSFHEFEALMSR